MSGCRKPVGTIYNISDHVVSAYINSRGSCGVARVIALGGASSKRRRHSRGVCPPNFYTELDFSNGLKHNWGGSRPPPRPLIYATEGKPRVCTSDTTQTQMLKMACETFQFYRCICKVILKIHLIEGEEIKVKFCKN